MKTQITRAPSRRRRRRRSAQSREKAEIREEKEL